MKTPRAALVIPACGVGHPRVRRWRSPRAAFETPPAASEKSPCGRTARGLMISATIGTIGTIVTIGTIASPRLHVGHDVQDGLIVNAIHLAVAIHVAVNAVSVVGHDVQDSLCVDTIDLAV